MKSCLRRGILVLGLAAVLTGCGDRETHEALDQAQKLEAQKQFEAANDVLLTALRAREKELRATMPVAKDELGVEDQAKKVQSDPEFLKMERAQLPIYLALDRPDLSSAVYFEILKGDPADTSIFALLKDPDPKIRAGAVRVLILADPAKAIDPLATATKDPDQDVRRAAVSALGTIKDPRTVPPLLGALKDPYWFARSEAADALGRQNDARAIGPLLDVVGDSDSTVESSAENALGQLAADRVGKTDDFAARLQDSNPKIATMAAVCLGLERDPRATPILLKLAASPDKATRLQAVKALGEGGDPTAAPILRQLLGDSDVNVRGWSIIGLGKLNDFASVPTLKALAADPAQPLSIQAAANAAINHIDGKSPSPADAR